MYILISVPDEVIAKQQYDMYFGVRSEKLIETIEQGRILTDIDSISRQEVLDLLTTWSDGYQYIELPTDDALSAIRKLTPTGVKMYTGHWIEDTNGTYSEDHDTWECSNCGEPFTLTEGTPEDNSYNFCPKCGANLQNHKESSTMLSLNEAITHCEEKEAELKQKSGFDTDNERYAMSDQERADCIECANEHRQLADWLKDYQHISEELDKLIDDYTYKWHELLDLLPASSILMAEITLARIDAYKGFAKQLKAIKGIVDEDTTELPKMASTIVRCKDCIHRDPEDHKCDCGMFERQGNIFPVKDDYFCAYGESKQSDNT